MSEKFQDVVLSARESPRLWGEWEPLIRVFESTFWIDEASVSIHHLYVAVVKSVDVCT